MKKIILILILLTFFTGCSKKEGIVEDAKEVKNNSIEIQNNEQKNIYLDNNNTPIAFYEGNGQKLKKISIFQTNVQPLEDIHIFQIYPSKEEEILLNEKFGNAFYSNWQQYNKDSNLKLGFHIEYIDIDNNTISYNILNPEMTHNIYDEHLLIYLYDDYINRNSNWYSHLEQEDVDENSLYTSIKIQAGGHFFKINSKIELTVFTYDGLDDFDELGNYRGNSSYTINICIDGIAC